MGGCSVGASVLDIESEGSCSPPQRGHRGLVIRPGRPSGLIGRLGLAPTVGPTVRLVTSTDLRYAIVTPARNERENLERLADSVLAQTLPPAYWMIVDDASDDGMQEVAAQLATRHAFIHVLNTAAGSDRLEAGRRQGRDLEAFRMGLRHLPDPVDVFVKVDADTSFDANYFAELMALFAAQPDLGIGGGSCWEERDGVWERIKVNAAHPRGASRAYRWALLDDVMALEPTLGWDGVDEVLAELRGYRTQGFTEIGFRHHRRVGEREGRLRAGSALGRQAWYMGYRPTYLLLRALYRTRANIASIAMVWGYAAAAAAGDPRCPNPLVLDRVRDEQRLRRVLRNRVPV
jgi:biofilm PGA synthesis N-glycosyltransferase PgaC